jgi:ribosome-binding factor A
MKTSPRSLKLASLIQSHIPAILQKMFTPDEIGFVTITAVESSGDLGIVDVFLSALNAPEDYILTLQQSTKKIRFELLKKIKLRREFILRFKPDNSIAHVVKVNKMLEDNQ